MLRSGFLCLILLLSSLLFASACGGDNGGVNDDPPDVLDDTVTRDTSTNDASTDTSTPPPAKCGDGVLDPGELCDPAITSGPGQCPTLCGDENACTSDQLVGDAAMCSATCSFDPVTACVSNDRCCPSGCTSADDSDCPGACGNGVVDADETCDGDCPSMCPNDDACTSYTRRGASETCDVTCDPTTISQCISGDGCCADGCTPVMDRDCETRCGDGVLDAGETCDGDCPTSCPDLGAMCLQSVLFGSADRCNAMCDSMPIVDCINNDGCCLPSCDGNNDNDCAPAPSWSCDPNAVLDTQRYTSVTGLQDQALISGLNALIQHPGLDYGVARVAMFGTIHLNANGVTEGVYTGRTVTPDGTTTPGDFNTEHSWPQSDGAGSLPARSDLHHLFPTQSMANSQRSNLAYGWTDCGMSGNPACDWSEAGSERGIVRGGSSTVFEVRPVSRGDIARAHFYFAVRYNMAIPAAEEQTLREWHCSDPPDAFERTRNARIETAQGNRNPFVDRPDFVDLISDF